MLRTIRSLWLVLGVLGGVLTLVWSATMTAVVHLLATTVLIMGGTGHPLVDPGGNLVEGQLGDDYIGAVHGKYVGVDPDDHLSVVWTPEEFIPVFGTRTFDQSVALGVGNLKNCVVGAACSANQYLAPSTTPSGFVVFGYSQSARVATIVKAGLIEQYRDPDTGDWAPGTPEASFILIGNPNRPDGGILRRFKGLYIPLLDVTFDGATPTDSCDATSCRFPTADITRQYDGWSDFPTYPLNLLADLNAVAGILYLHSDYLVGTEANPVDTYLWQGRYGDTHYYMIPTGRLPLLEPLAQIGIPAPILTALDAPLRVLVEWGYDRDGTPGDPTGAKVLRLKNPISDLVNLAVAIPTGWDDGISQAVGDPGFRPFQTKPSSSPFGVGGREDLPKVEQPSVPAGTNDTPQLVNESPSPQGQFAGSGDKFTETSNIEPEGAAPRATKVETPKRGKGPLARLLRTQREADRAAEADRTAVADKPKAWLPFKDRPHRQFLNPFGGRHRSGIADERPPAGDTAPPRQENDNNAGAPAQ